MKKGDKVRERILSLLRKNPNLTLVRLQKACGIKHYSTLAYHMERLIDGGNVRIGDRWIVTRFYD